MQTIEELVKESDRLIVAKNEEEEQFLYLPEHYYLKGPDEKIIFPDTRAFRLVKIVPGA
jgi:hypothetical protein